MADKIPLKSDAGEFKNFQNKDTIPIKHGGTGTTRFIHQGYVLENGKGKLTTVKMEFTKRTNPTPAHDFYQGYSIGSRWINIEEKREWLCVANRARNAIWISCCSLDETDTGEQEDEFRHFGSLVDFKYDFQKFFWERRSCQDAQDVIKVEYRNGGSPPSAGTLVGTMEIFYNENFQPVLAVMTYEDNTVASSIITYDQNDYLDEVIRV